MGGVMYTCHCKENFTTIPDFWNHVITHQNDIALLMISCRNESIAITNSCIETALFFYRVIKFIDHKIESIGVSDDVAHQLNTYKENLQNSLDKLNNRIQQAFYTGLIEINGYIINLTYQNNILTINNINGGEINKERPKMGEEYTFEMLAKVLHEEFCIVGKKPMVFIYAGNTFDVQSRNEYVFDTIDTIDITANFT
jgi:hypothetical protein